MSKEWKWLDSTTPVQFNSETRKVIQAIDKMNVCGAEKNALLHYYMDHPQMQRKANLQKEIKSWMRMDAYQKIKEQIKRDDQSKFTIAGIVIIMMATLFLFFLRAVLFKKFLINFSIDAIVGAIALVLLGRNLHIKYRVLDRYLDSHRWYLCIDVASFILCALLKFAFSPMFDFSLIILFISFVLQKKKLEKTLQSF